jgi:uncharacterized protein (DUF305 family)
MKTLATPSCAGLLMTACIALCQNEAVDGRSPLFSQVNPQPPPLVQPGAPGEPSRIIKPEQATDLSQVEHTAADATFMQEMIGHHAQALEMVDLLRTRTERADMRLLGNRIRLSQADEIKMMQEWLQARGQPLPDPHAHHRDGATLMPGMLTAEEMARLSAATGAAFDRLFLDLMIKHHLGALTMVEKLLATAGAAQESEIFAFTADIVADQRMEMDRMGAMLKEIQK